MTFQEFDALKANFQALENKISDVKGTEYANSEDRLANFKRMAAKRGIPAITAAAILLDKHLDAIDYVINGKAELSETFEQRILDARVYLMLIYALYIEGQEKPESNSAAKVEFKCPNCASTNLGYVDSLNIRCRECYIVRLRQEFIND